jgi:hypothetical protein
LERIERVTSPDKTSSIQTSMVSDIIYKHLENTNRMTINIYDRSVLALKQAVMGYMFSERRHILLTSSRNSCDLVLCIKMNLYKEFTF